MKMIAHSDGRHRFTVEGPARYPFVVDAEHDGAAIGPRPQELLLESLASCLGVTTLAVLEKKRVPVAGMIVHVDGEKNPDRPYDFVSFHVHVESAGATLTDATLARTMEIADRNCPVSRTLAKAVPVQVSHAVLTLEDLLNRLTQAADGQTALQEQVATLQAHLAKGERAQALAVAGHLRQAWARLGSNVPLGSAAGDLTLVCGLLQPPTTQDANP